MELYDTHAHFGTKEDVTAGVLARAQQAGVTRLMAVGGNTELNAAAVLAQAMRPDAVRLALGADRDQAELPHDEILADIRRQHACHSCAAVGEIGLDYHYSPETREAQRELFGAQLEEAAKRSLPVIIHTREADDDTLALLREVPSRGVIHCYTGTPEAAKAFLDLGFYISFSGIVTFRLADNVRAAAAVVPDDRILIETDSPFLAPVPLRGRPNEPAFVRHVCEFLAALRKVSAEDFAELTFANAEAALGVDARAGNC
jgi:TatD DNase family protein